MTKVVIDMSMSLDGFVAGPDDGAADPLGRHGGMHDFDWHFSGDEEYRDPLFRPEPVDATVAFTLDTYVTPNRKFAERLATTAEAALGSALGSL